MTRKKTDTLRLIRSNDVIPIYVADQDTQVHIRLTCFACVSALHLAMLSNYGRVAVQ